MKDMVDGSRAGGWKNSDPDEVARLLGLAASGDILVGLVMHRSGRHLWDVYYQHANGACGL